MYFEEKIIASSLMFIFAFAVYFTKHRKGANPSFMWPLYHYFFNKDGTEKKYTKNIFILFFIILGISFWIFPDFWLSMNK